MVKVGRGHRTGCRLAAARRVSERRQEWVVWQGLGSLPQVWCATTGNRPRIPERHCNPRQLGQRKRWWWRRHADGAANGREEQGVDCYTRGARWAGRPGRAGGERYCQVCERQQGEYSEGLWQNVSAQRRRGDAGDDPWQRFCAQVNDALFAHSPTPAVEGRSRRGWREGGQEGSDAAAAHECLGTCCHPGRAGGSLQQVACCCGTRAGTSWAKHLGQEEKKCSFQQVRQRHTAVGARLG
mmetsp:Transcript_85138/g.138070  ORF Transcript_85138/g.138070 Transcript_85138/m.138070 type:complete len:240 (+) Transcript_85138:684-1403(+)